MPTTYAHYRLGQEIRTRVKEKERRRIDAYPELFDIGLHGPDILFYYKPLFSDPVSQLGHIMHRRMGREFFTRAAGVVRTHKSQEAHLSYVYGVICHFSLDALCHAYIAEKMEKSGISHAEIESEFDRELMVIDGLDPVRHRLTGHLTVSNENAEIISDFYRGIEAKQVKRAVRSMKFYTDILTAPSKIKRSIIHTLLRLAGKYDELQGMMISYEKNPKCEDSTKKLMELYDESVGTAVRLIDEYGNYLEGTAPLDSMYRYTFSGAVTPEENTASEGK